MAKAVFFDWYNTLVYYKPARHQVFSKAFQEFGIELATKDVIRGIFAADRYYLKENAKLPLKKRSPQEQFQVYLYYPKAILAEAQVEEPEGLLRKVLQTADEQMKKANFVLFDDVLSTLQSLKDSKKVLGLLTNATRSAISVHRDLGVEPYLDFIVTSEEAGADKPEPPMFLAALEHAGVEASEAVHIGDQYELDVAGARGVGITPVLIDRYDVYPEITDCHRVNHLSELYQYL